MQNTTQTFPEEIRALIGEGEFADTSGCSGAQTLYIPRINAFLKIAPCGSLTAAARMQAFFAAQNLSAPLLQYVSADRDYMLTAAIPGLDGTAPRHLAEPQRLSEVFGTSLRRLHDASVAGCPVTDRNARLLCEAQTAQFRADHLLCLAPYIGPADENCVPSEIAETAHILQTDALIHGDYCLPNIMLDDWRLSGFIDLADGGLGDRHYDLAWGLWTLRYNLKSDEYGHHFLDAYGRDLIDKKRLRLCGLLAAMA